MFVEKVTASASVVVTGSIHGTCLCCIEGPLSLVLPAAHVRVQGRAWHDVYQFLCFPSRDENKDPKQQMEDSHVYAHNDSFKAQDDAIVPLTPGTLAPQQRTEQLRKTRVPIQQQGQHCDTCAAYHPHTMCDAHAQIA